MQEVVYCTFHDTVGGHRYRSGDRLYAAIFFYQRYWLGTQPAGAGYQGFDHRFVEDTTTLFRLGSYARFNRWLHSGTG